MGKRCPHWLPCSTPVGHTSSASVSTLNPVGSAGEGVLQHCLFSGELQLGPKPLALAWRGDNVGVGKAEPLTSPSAMEARSNLVPSILKSNEWRKEE